MKQTKFKRVMEEGIKTIWVYKIFKWFSKNKQGKNIHKRGAIKNARQ